MACNTIIDDANPLSTSHTPLPYPTPSHVLPHIQIQRPISPRWWWRAPAAHHHDQGIQREDKPPGPALPPVLQPAELCDSPAAERRGLRQSLQLDHRQPAPPAGALWFVPGVNCQASVSVLVCRYFSFCCSSSTLWFASLYLTSFTYIIAPYQKKISVSSLVVKSLSLSLSYDSHMCVFMLIWTLCEHVVITKLIIASSQLSIIASLLW